MTLTKLTSADQLKALVEDIGFIPLFRGLVEGFSVEELTPEEFWFKKGVAGPWEWREEIAAEGKIAYAKLFRGHAGFVSMDIYPHLANYRRDGYDFDARVDEGLVRNSQRKLYDLIQSGIYLASDLRRNFGQNGFDAALTALQMGTYITITGFERKRDRRGMPYGWSTGCYDISERAFGADVCTGAYDVDPEESFRILEKRLRDIMPGADALRLFGI